MALWVPDGESVPFGPGYGRRKPLPSPYSHPFVLPCGSAPSAAPFPSNPSSLSHLESSHLPVGSALGSLGFQELKPILDGSDSFRWSQEIQLN